MLRSAPPPARADDDRLGAPPSLPLVVTRDEGLIEHVLAAAASVGTSPLVTGEEEVVLRGWRSASCVLVGADLAALVASLRLPARSGVHVAGTDRDELLSWSIPLDASVLLLPDQRALLASVIDPRLEDNVGPGRLVRVVGASGGLGASTIAVGLAQVAARRALPAAVVDLDPFGGGLDLLIGAESAPGWRWNDLRRASGRIESLAGHLPNVSGIDVLAVSRPVLGGAGHRMRRAEGAASNGPAPFAPSGDAVRSVISALTRSHRLVVVDAARGGGALAEQWSGCRTLLVVAAGARGVAAAAARVADLPVPDVSLVVRTGAGRGMDADTVARAVGRPVAGVVRDDRRLPASEAVGDPPGRARGRFRRDLERLFGEVMRDDR